jgi:predicted transcriptional regulator YdeE
VGGVPHAELLAAVPLVLNNGGSYAIAAIAQQGPLISPGACRSNDRTFDSSESDNPSMTMVHRESFAVSGHEAETTNAREFSGLGVIAQLWSAVDASGGPLIAVYSAYESDRDGKYSYLLGVEVDAAQQAAEHLRLRIVEEGDYLCLKHEGQVTPQAVVDLWQQVWTLEDRGELARAYRTDFETYTAHGMELYVGVR